MAEVGPIGTRSYGFGILVVRSVEDIAFNQIGDQLALTEDLATGEQLRGVLRGFYPRVQDKDTFRVLHFSSIGGLCVDQGDAENRGWPLDVFNTSSQAYITHTKM